MASAAPVATLEQILRLSFDLPPAVIAERSDAVTQLREKARRYRGRADRDRTGNSAALRLVAEALDNEATLISIGNHRQAQAVT